MPIANLHSPVKVLPRVTSALRPTQLKMDGPATMRMARAGSNAGLGSSPLPRNVGIDPFGSLYSPSSPFESVASPSNSQTFQDLNHSIGRKTPDHLVYLSLDVEEEDLNQTNKRTSSTTPTTTSSSASSNVSAGGTNNVSWLSVPLKTESDGSIIFKFTALRKKKFILSLLQVDQDMNIFFHSLKSVTIEKMFRIRGMLRTDYPVTGGLTSLASIRLNIIEQSLHRTHRLLLATIDFGQILQDHDLMRDETREGDRIGILIHVTLTLERATQTVVIPFELISKVYRKSQSSKSSGSTPTGAAGVGIVDPIRLSKLGHNFLITRSILSSSLTPIYQSHLTHLQQLLQHLRLEQCQQHVSWLRILQKEGMEIQRETYGEGTNTTNLAVTASNKNGEKAMKYDDIRRLPKQIRAASIQAFIGGVDSMVRITKGDNAKPFGNAALSSSSSSSSSSTLARSKVLSPPSFSSPASHRPSPVNSISSSTRAAPNSGAAAGHTALSSSLEVVVTRVPRVTGVRNGFLYKQAGYDSATSGTSGKWAPKWCVLRPPYLCYYQKKTDIREKGIVHLFQAKVQLDTELNANGTKKVRKHTDDTVHAGCGVDGSDESSS